MAQFFPSRFLTGLAFVFSFFALNSAFASANVVNVLEYLEAHVQTPANPSTVTKYNRAKHFGGWVKQDPANKCHDTREMVLSREEDSKISMTYSKNGCTVTTGLWHEPYAGKDFTDAPDIQIDHVVPLKEAYYSGAYGWSGSVRCNYANFLANDFHLRAVSGHENMAKGDHAPDHYLPPNSEDLCDYVGAWMKIKTIWQLTATVSEVAAIKDVLQMENCDDSFIHMDSAELAQQQMQASTPIAACENFGK